MQLVRTFFTLKNNDVIKHNLENGTSEKIFTVGHCYFPKVAFTQKGRVFLIGGSKNQQQTQVINKTFELKIIDGTYDL